MELLTSGEAKGSAPYLFTFLPPVGVIADRAERGVLMPGDSSSYRFDGRGIGEEIAIGPGGALRGMAKRREVNDATGRCSR